MGLHLCYELTLPGTTAVEDVRAKVASLKRFSLDLGFERVYGPAEYTLAELSEPPDRRDILHFIATTMSGDDPLFPGASRETCCALAFIVAPGRQCEPATFGFLRPGSRSLIGDSDYDVHPREWYWSFCCKTQYASVISDEHLVRCHTGLVRLLDHAASLDIGVLVEDETGYWEHRSPERLIAAVKAMNQTIARLAGALSDQLAAAGGDTEAEHRVDAPIFEHPEFEHLEMEGGGYRGQADGATDDDALAGGHDD